MRCCGSVYLRPGHCGLRAAHLHQPPRRALQLRPDVQPARLQAQPDHLQRRVPLLCPAAHRTHCPARFCTGALMWSAAVAPMLPSCWVLRGTWRSVLLCFVPCRIVRCRYHIVHHENSRCHWSEMPAAFIKNIDKYRPIPRLALHMHDAHPAHARTRAHPIRAHAQGAVPRVRDAWVTAAGRTGQA